ncbi:MAG: di-heme oxidoredictase family protein [Isosphaeraceae bacterium]|nr:di-heme oxidoredictase family protein [Isosphaeraceae bacterium]
MGPDGGIVIGVGFLAGVFVLAAAPDEGARKALIAEGSRLFVREWTPGDPSAHGGDGLGPVYNATSCVACHHQGGVGGAGPADKNVEQVSALGRLAATEAIQADLRKLHPGFDKAATLPLHRHGLDEGYDRWRAAMLKDNVRPDEVQYEAAQNGSRSRRDIARAATLDNRSLRLNLPIKHGGASIARTEINTPALFGSGCVDAIPAQAIEKQVGNRLADFPEIKGRVSRLADGRLGRFGWKAQAATLDDFVLTACAVELGLEVPGRSQSLSPAHPDETAPGLDLSRRECDALTTFVRDLPRPVAQRPETEIDMAAIRTGARLFRMVGCAVCHVPSLGGVDGLFSDLLLHDMGVELSSDGSYYPDTSLPPRRATPWAADDPARRPPASTEWRTPPLWGLRDSGPYLHDGRAHDIEVAIALHGGEAAATSKRYFDLSRSERFAVERLLKSLASPSSSGAGEHP